MDVMDRIRRLLGGDTSQKRKQFDEHPGAFESILKKIRSTKGDSEHLSNNFDLEESTASEFARIRAKHTRQSDSFYPNKSKMGLNYGQTQQRKFCNTNNPSIDFNTASEFDDVPRSNDTYMSRSNASQLNGPRSGMTNGTFSTTATRKVPGLMKVNSFQQSFSFPKPQQTIQPHYGQHRKQFSHIPDLYPINSIQAVDPYANNSGLVNGSYQSASSNSLALRDNFSRTNRTVSRQNAAMNHSPPMFTNFSSAKNYITSWGCKGQKKQNNASIQKPESGNERSAYASLLKLIPGLQAFSKPKQLLPSDSSKVSHTIDLLNEPEAEISKRSNLLNLTSVGPVNTLRTRLETSAVFKEEWVKDINKEYSENSLNRSQSMKVEKQKSLLAEKKTREVESKYFESFDKLSLESAYLYEEDEEEEEPANDYPTLDAEMQQKVFKWISGRDAGTVLNTKFSISITRHDVQTLNWNPLTWLNDEVINFYMEMLGERSKLNDSLPKVYGMNTFFLKRLLETGYSGVRRWTRKVDIFSYDILVIPVHKGIHWCMSIIHLKNKTIKYYDSMGAPSNQVLKALADYLKEESMDKKKTEFDFTGWTTENVADIPQQENGSDCGVFSCMYAEFICRNRPIVFTQQHMQYFRMKMIFEICSGQMLN